jgi:hypothetical protein
LHLVSFLCELYITMHGSINIGETYLRFSSYAEYTSTIFLRKWPNLYQNTGYHFPDACKLKLILVNQIRLFLSTSLFIRFTTRVFKTSLNITRVCKRNCAKLSNPICTDVSFHVVILTSKIVAMYFICFSIRRLNFVHRRYLKPYMTPKIISRFISKKYWPVYVEVENQCVFSEVETVLCFSRYSQHYCWRFRLSRMLSRVDW